VKRFSDKIMRYESEVGHGPCPNAPRRKRLNYWPGFVDALSTLILSIIFI